MNRVLWPLVLGNAVRRPAGRRRSDTQPARRPRRASARCATGSAPTCAAAATSRRCASACSPTACCRCAASAAAARRRRTGGARAPRHDAVDLLRETWREVLPLVAQVKPTARRRRGAGDAAAHPVGPAASVGVQRPARERLPRRARRRVCRAGTGQRRSTCRCSRRWCRTCASASRAASRWSSSTRCSARTRCRRPNTADDFLAAAGLLGQAALLRHGAAMRCRPSSRRRHRPSPRRRRASKGRLDRRTGSSTRCAGRRRSPAGRCRAIPKHRRRR